MTRYLLDTHALVWWWLKDPKLSDRASEAMSAEEVLVSAASLYEIANKVRRDQLDALRELLTHHEVALAEDGFAALPVNNRHARHAGLLEGRHRDPFDRMIAGQALVENLTVITRDRQIAALGCKVLW